VTLLPANVAFGFDLFLVVVVMLAAPHVIGALIFGGVAAAVVGPRRWRSIRLPALAAFSASFLSVFFGPAVLGRSLVEMAILQAVSALVAAGAQRLLWDMAANGGADARTPVLTRGAIIGALVGADIGILPAVGNSRNMLVLVAITAIGVLVGMVFARGRSSELALNPIPVADSTTPPPVAPPPQPG
jgi:hypothetical protein